VSGVAVGGATGCSVVVVEGFHVVVAGALAALFSIVPKYWVHTVGSKLSNPLSGDPASAPSWRPGTLFGSIAATGAGLHVAAHFLEGAATLDTTCGSATPFTCCSWRGRPACWCSSWPAPS
jgi:hypothetical protein